jgi:hypothetical protein
MMQFIVNAWEWLKETFRNVIMSLNRMAQNPTKIFIIDSGN